MSRAHWRAGHARDTFMGMCSFPSLPRALEHAEQAGCYLADVRREAGRREVEAQHDAGSRVPHLQGRVPAQQDYHHAKREHYR